jgi:hypothetical protein
MFTAKDSSLKPLSVDYMVQASHRDIAEQVDSGTDELVSSHISGPCGDHIF